MKTRINLYLDELKPKKEYLTLNNVAFSWLALIVVLVAVSGFLMFLESSSKQQVAQLQATLDVTKKQLQQTQEALQRKQDKSPLMRRIDKQKQELSQKQRLLFIMEDKSEQAEFDYAEVMTDLAANGHGDVWLTAFHFVGHDITISGAATHGSAIPVWLNGLKDSDYFVDKAFSLLEFNNQEGGVSFQVATKYTEQGAN